MPPGRERERAQLQFSPEHKFFPKNGMKWF
jgi:hypothetical protein